MPVGRPSARHDEADPVRLDLVVAKKLAHISRPSFEWDPFDLQDALATKPQSECRLHLLLGNLYAIDMHTTSKKAHHRH